MTDTIASGTKDQITELVRKHGLDAVCRALFSYDPLGAAAFCSRLYTDHKEREAYLDARETLNAFKEAIPKFLQLVESKEIKVVQGAFNSSATFITAFPSTALAAIPLALLVASDAITAVGSTLKKIKSELAISNMAKVQGWGQDGFGGHVHGFVFKEMQAVKASHSHHYFYVWHPDTDWHQKFEERQKKEPLGPNFGGYNADLHTVCLRMRSDRAILVETTEDGRDAIFHLLIPTYYPIVMKHQLVFHPALFPLVVTGQDHRTSNLVWFTDWDFYSHPLILPGLTFDHIGVVSGYVPPVSKACAYTSLSSYAAMMASAAATVLFPPFAVGAGLACSGFFITSSASAIGYAAASNIESSGVQVLGNTLSFPPRLGNFLL